MIIFATSTVSLVAVMQDGEQPHATPPTAWTRSFEQVTVTPEWLASNETKQQQYEQDRQKWRLVTGVILDE